jgi:hypothetical protein
MISIEKLDAHISNVLKQLTAVEAKQTNGEFSEELSNEYEELLAILDFLSEDKERLQAFETLAKCETIQDLENYYLEGVG